MQTGQIEPNREGSDLERRTNFLLWFALGCLAVATFFACLVIVTATGVILINHYGRSSGELLSSSDDNVVQQVLPTVPAQNLPLVVPSPTPSTIPTETSVSLDVTTTATATGIVPTPLAAIPSEIRQMTPPENAYRHLSEMMAADYPARDYFETADRLGRTEVGKRSVVAEPVQVGDRANFTTDDGLREAVLVAVSEHAYFWVESTLDYEQELIKEAAEQFESAYFPAVAKLYGTGWQDGIDDDPRFSVLHLDGYAEGSELGFFNSGDQYPRSINSSSNEQEIVYLNMENLKPGEPLYYGTLVHELQHLIQWHSDPNEPVWLSEGLAQFTELYVGLDTVDTYYDYANAPGTQLNTWLQDAGDEIFAHYGAAYLFVVYLWEQFGDQAIQDLMQQPADGLSGVSAILAERDPLMTLDQFILNWATANFVDNRSYGPIYDYEHLSLPEPEYQARIDQVPFETMQAAQQFGASYYRLDLEGQHTLTFAGDSLVDLVPTSPHDGETMWYVPALNELDAQLTASFDLTGLTQAELTFWTWYDLEEGYDFAYVSASVDGGSSWDLLMPEHAKAGEYGPGLTGQSNRLDRSSDGWIEESVSLAPYTGGRVTVRFEVVSDSAIAKSGFALDDIAISGLDYFSDVESETSEWQARGFVRTGSEVPQMWRLGLILPGSSPQIMALELDERNFGSWSVDIGDKGAVLVVTAQTPFASSKANYWLSVEK